MVIEFVIKWCPTEEREVAYSEIEKCLLPLAVALMILGPKDFQYLQTVNEAEI
jgi:hypothetical protein